MYLGIDIGGTKLEAVLIEKSSLDTIQQISKKRAATERDKGYDQIITNLAKLVRDTCGSNLTNLKAIGIGLPGSIDPKSGMMIKGNTRVLENKPVVQDLKKNLGIETPVFLENDANCFALAEVCLGAGLQYQKDFDVRPADQTAVGVILGTGVGGGIIVQGKVVGGRRGAGGEIGHTTLHEDGRECYCGRKGCVEQYLSGPAVEQEYFKETGKKLPALEALQTSPRILGSYQSDLAFFLGNLTNVLDPDYFILGGGVSLQKKIYSNLSEKIKTHLFVNENPPPVYQHLVSDSAGSLGAAMVAWSQIS